MLTCIYVYIYVHTQKKLNKQTNRHVYNYRTTTKETTHIYIYIHIYTQTHLIIPIFEHNEWPRVLETAMSALRLARADVRGHPRPGDVRFSVETWVEGLGFRG